MMGGCCGGAVLRGEEAGEVAGDGRGGFQESSASRLGSVAPCMKARWETYS